MARTTTKSAPKPVRIPRELSAWEREVYSADPTGGNPSNY